MGWVPFKKIPARCLRRVKIILKMELTKLKEKIKNGYAISFEEAITLSEIEDKEALYALAGELRLHFLGRNFDTCSIMNARSGRCSEDCKWCAQSACYHTKVEVYPLVSLNEAMEQACYHAKQGARRFSLVTSGRAVNSAETQRLAEIYRAVKKEVPVKLCASLGLLNKEQLQLLRESGVERYHCNLETAPSFFSSLCTTHTVEQKIQTLRWAREAGLKICSGGIIGMGENMKQRIELAFALRDLKADSIPVNILNPIPGTPLENMPPLTDEEILVTFALFRIINPTAHIRFAGGRSKILHIQEKAMQSGISAALIGNLLTTVGPDMENDRQTIERLGFVIM